MVMLPDYPERVISEHSNRVERTALFASLLLIAVGAWWLLGSMQSDSNLLLRFGPVVLMFSAAMLMLDLAEFGPIQRTRVSTACSVVWIPILAFMEYERSNGSEILPIVAILAVASSLWFVSWRILGESVNSRRWRGLGALFGLGLALPIVLSLRSPSSLGVVLLPALASIIPDLFSRDGLQKQRSEFSSRLNESEARLLSIQSEGVKMQQSASLLKTAREMGWRDPARGLELIQDAEREFERILAITADLTEIRSDVERSVTSAEGVTGSPGESRRLLDAAIEEFANGSLREAEQNFRLAKSKAIEIEAHWMDAAEAIENAESAIGKEEGHLVRGLKETIRAAKKAMKDENPQRALAIVSEIPSQMSGIDGLMDKAKQAIEEAEQSLESLEGSTSESSSTRILDAKEALKSGDPSLAIGLAEGISREQKSISGAMSMVQRSLRQRKLIEERLPSGDGADNWHRNLDSIEDKASRGEWIGAAEDLAKLTFDLESFESERAEAREMIDFLSKDWQTLRKRLDSSGIGPDDSSRIASEKALAQAESSLERGNLEACLSSLGSADSAIEALRRRV